MKKLTSNRVKRLMGVEEAPGPTDDERKIKRLLEI